MLVRTRLVEVHQVQKQVNALCERSFLLNLRESITTERPRFVLDCSQVCEINSATIHLLLSSLEEAMKCNGDVRLASLRLDAESALKMAGVRKLFQIYSTVEAAAQSFHQRPTNISSQAHDFDREVVIAA